MDIASLFPLYRQKGILIDTNILLLYFVGSVNRQRISKFNRTQQFLPEDFDLLQSILAYFQEVVTTPNVLTEVGNLMNKLGEPERSECFKVFSQGILSFNEIYIESRTISINEKFAKFGLTDCCILNVAKNQYLVLTDDLKLAVYLQSQGVDTVNFNNLRVYNWRSN